MNACTETCIHTTFVCCWQDKETTRNFTKYFQKKNCKNKLPKIKNSKAAGKSTKIVNAKWSLLLLLQFTLGQEEGISLT